MDTLHTPHDTSVDVPSQGPEQAIPAMQVCWARRNPRLLFRLSGLFLLRFAERTFLG
jgi:hypothetical protein